MTGRQLQSLWDGIAAAGHPRTGQLARTIVHKALADAVRLGHLAANPVDRTIPPRLETRAPREPDAPEDLLRLWDAAGDRWRPLFVVAALTGLRRGEILGLQWPDWDAASGTLTIRRTIVGVGSRAIVQDAPKTRAGWRRLTLPRRRVPEVPPTRPDQRSG